ncbi:unnamed protein product [Somion occarium]|uniref:Ino eighty subunit 1 n=1 Tax=Somion occarium TaxID=3059160 RepID=A0ABP1CNK3_9APHY
MPNPGPQGNHRKSLAVKHLDGEPLSRADLQYDFLHYLFSDTKAVFTDPFPTIHGGPPGTKVTFRDLYVNSLVQSSRCSKVTKERLVENPLFGDEFAKISILSNVGRINTTMAFFPEMRTNLRTYHPVPSLQKSDGNLQDAPRIKNILKSCLLPTESPNEPLTPADILAKSRSGQIPPTTVVNLIFVFAAHSSIIAQSHFASQTNYDLLDFFCPINISSESRGRAFLWLCYHYLEGPNPNPFADEFALANPGKTPRLRILSAEETLLENVDPSSEKEWGERMTIQRREFVANKDKPPVPGEEGSIEPKHKEKAKPAPKVRGGRGGRGGRKSRPGPQSASTSQNREILPRLTMADEMLSNNQDELMSEASGPTSQPMAMSPVQSPHHIAERAPSPAPFLAPIGLRAASFPSSSTDEYSSPEQSRVPSRHTSRLPSPIPRLYNARERAEPYPRPLIGPPNAKVPSTSGKAVRTRVRKPYKKYHLPPASHRVSQFPLVPVHPPMRSQKSGSRQEIYRAATPTPTPPPAPRRSIVEQAFHAVMNSDPLDDSEDDEPLDENTRLDLLLRLRIINRLRGKEPTPEPEPRHIYSHPIRY